MPLTTTNLTRAWLNHANRGREIDVLEAQIACIETDSSKVIASTCKHYDAARVAEYEPQWRWRGCRARAPEETSVESATGHSF